MTNSYAQLPAHFYAEVLTEPAPQPLLFAWNPDLATELGLEHLNGAPDRQTAIFSGNTPLPGGKTIALAYAGHQFGHFVPQLGDGRAALIGEVVSATHQKRFDIQLKGSGATPFSRNGDGKSSLGPVVREYLLSEAMYKLGIPTTRALAAVATGEQVMRNGMEPAGVLTRVASSHIRVGTFQYFAAREDKAALSQLTDYAIERHYPQAAESPKPVTDFFSGVVKAQAKLVAHWMAVGFIHGVMNTDNCAISGETLDYGPCAFMDEFHINKVFSSIDRQGRYAYGQQATMAQWNLARLAECLLMIDGDKSDYETSLADFMPTFEQHYFSLMRTKLGLVKSGNDDTELVTSWLQHLQDRQLDYHLSFRQLMKSIENGFSDRFGDFEKQWHERITNQPGGKQQALALMATSNPVVIPRNHQIANVIDAAFEGDFTPFEKLHQLLSDPYNPTHEETEYANAPTEQQRIQQTFCGT